MRGLSLLQTVQGQPMAGTPTEVPVPKMISCPVMSRLVAKGDTSTFVVHWIKG